MITEIITEITSKMAGKELSKMKNSEPEKYDQTLKLFITAAEVGIHFLEESPEFRKAFADIHSRFLDYPETRSLIEKGIRRTHELGITDMS